MAKIGTEVFKVILVTTLLYFSEKCNSESDNTLVSNISPKEGPNNLLEYVHGKRIPFRRAYRRLLPIDRLRFEREQKMRIQDLFKKFQKNANPRKYFFNTPHKPRRLLRRRLTRQAYPEYKPTLYPSLPTPLPSYYRQPYFNNNYPQSNLTNYSTSPSIPPWLPTNMYNYTQPGYPGYFQKNNYSNNYPMNPGPYNMSHPFNNPWPSPSVSPNPINNPLFGHGHGHRYPYTQPTNFNNFGPQNSSGYQPSLNTFNIHNQSSTSYWSPHGIRNNTFTYNPSQRPSYYPSGDSTSRPYSPSYPSYSTTQKYSIPSFNSSQRTPNPYNYPTQHGQYNKPPSGFFTNNLNIPGYNDGPILSGHHESCNPGPYYPNHSGLGVQPSQLNTSASFPNKNTSPYNASLNGYRPYNGLYQSGQNVSSLAQNYNSSPGQSNNFHVYNLTKPNSNPGVGFNGHNNYTHSYNGYQGSTALPGGGLYPQQQYNGTSTYRLANNYTPNIPNQPTRKDNFGQSNFFYPSNVTDDPSRVPPERFSY